MGPTRLGTALLLLLSVACSSPESSLSGASTGGGGSAPTGGSGSGGSSSSGEQPTSSGGNVSSASGGTFSGGSSSGGTLGGGSSSGGNAQHDSGGTSSGGTASGGASPAGTGGAETATGGNDGGGGSPGGNDGSGGTPGGTVPLTVYIAGDSTVSTYPDTASSTDQAGWGQMFAQHYNDLVTVENHAIGGRTARRFIDEGRLQAIWDEIAAGDYLLVQFGTNDGHTSATYEINGQEIPYYLDPATDFKDYLKVYVEGAAERDVQLVFVTPPPRNSAYCTGGNGTFAHAQAMRELAQEQGVPLADLNEKTVAHLMAICPAPTPEDFFLLRSDGSVDGTHFQENGARIMSRFVADGIAEAMLPLKEYESESE